MRRIIRRSPKVSPFMATVLDDADATSSRSTLGFTSGKLYFKDAQATPHYWQYSADTSGDLVKTDAGTTLPTDGIVILP